MRWLLIAVSIAGLLGQPARAAPDVAQIVARAVADGEGTWKRAGELSAGLTSRELYACALALCEASQGSDRLLRLLQVGARMQDLDPESRGYGNFRWSWEDGAVLDFNAVEFCMQSAAILRIKHFDALPDDARAALAETLELATEGCLRHRVSPGYTNIALMNAQNLILLGEALGKPEVADEGYKRLDRVCIHTWESGIREYDSPTYYGVDLDCLGLIEAFCRRESGRQQARALLELFWQDLAANWYAPAGRLGGARSRDYDYLRGLGYLDSYPSAAGWLEPPIVGSIHQAFCRWWPDEALLGQNRTRYPRLVRQKWGLGAQETKTHYVCRDVTLSTAGAGYGTMDLPLTVDLPGSREAIRCYLIPDGRRDPYGKKKIPEGPHEKTLHLRPFFAGTQRTTDALGLVIYRSGDVPENPPTLETHFVMPRDMDAIFLGDKRVELSEDTALVEPVAEGSCVVLRKGTAAVGLRVPWSRGLDGSAAPVALVWDGNPYGALRLTVAHHSFWGVESPTGRPGACLWVRIGSGLQSDADFDTWRESFAAAEPQVQDTPEGLSCRVEAANGPLALATAPPYSGCSELLPAPCASPLELDGEDIGGPILAALPVVEDYKVQLAAKPELQSVEQGSYIEAESGQVVLGMEVGKDAEASGGQFVWAPGKPGEKGGGEGSVTWRLQLPEAAPYFVWARLKTPTPEDDSFFVRAFTPTAEPVGQTDWHTGVHEAWEWTPLRLAQGGQITPLNLPQGEVSLQLRAREDGAAVDQLFITPYEDQKPQ